MTTEFVLSALDMALQQRRPEGVIRHSDQGSQYTSVAFGERCKKMGVSPSGLRLGTTPSGGTARRTISHL